MLLDFEDLRKYRRRVTMVGGGFDPLHGGHIEYLRAAHELGLPVLCNLASDEYVRSKHAPFLPEDERAAIVDALRYVAYTHVNRCSVTEVLVELQPRYFVKGKDWEGRLPAGEVAACRGHGIEIVYVDTVRNSSSQILRSYFSAHGPNVSAHADQPGSRP